MLMLVLALAVPSCRPEYERRCVKTAALEFALDFGVHANLCKNFLSVSIHSASAVPLAVLKKPFPVAASKATLRFLLWTVLDS